MDSDDHLYVIDFTKGAMDVGAERADDWVPDVDVILSTGKAKLLDKRVMHNNVTGGWRAFFKLDVPDATDLLEMSCELKDGNADISERWIYQWRR